MQVDEQSADLWRELFEGAPDQQAVAGPDGRVVLASAAWLAATPARPAQGELLLDADRWSRELGTTAATALVDGVAATLRERREVRIELPGRGPDSPARVEVTSWPLDAGSAVVRLSRLPEARVAHAAALRRSTHDALTGLPGRFLVEERLTQASVAARRTRGAVAVLVIDLDDFTAIDTTHGHDVADEVLIGVARRLQRCVRPSDTVGRLVADQFVIAVAGYPAGLAAEEIATRVTRAMEDPFRAGGRRIRVAVSIGIHTATSWDEEPEELVAAAYDAMARAKAAGGGRTARSGRGALPAGAGGEPVEVVLGAGYPAEEGDEGYAGSVLRLLRLLRLQVGMDVAWTSEFVGSEQVFRFVDAARGALAPTPGTGLPLAGAYCTSVLNGTMPALIPDARADPQGALLPVTFELRIGSYLGVPLQDPDGSTRGMLCAIGAAPAPDLGSDDLNSARLIAEVLEDMHYRALHEAEEMRLHEDLRDQVAALCDGEGRTAVLQPIVDLRTGEIVAAEGLTRFRGSERGPAQWFAAAASVGMTGRLEVATGRAALLFLDPPISAPVVTVNMSPSVVTDGGLDVLLDGCDPARVVLEITEHAPVTSYEDLHEVLAPFRARGMRIAVDDAGAGYASMRHVLRLRPDLIKIDMSLVRGIDDDPVRRALVGALHDFAVSSGATTIAEGVETGDELRALAGLGVVLVQGFLFGEPAPTIPVLEPGRWTAEALHAL
ncbi:diguanylate cyclase (GGDEF)-like protein [Motilibacter rhizosphaerae]|uniref:Diguanylate cyclase (GGDEF)-like protein n=1 Tax=Motilibacter rhizosphaerae TaxID=598652 RepID=A0A4V2F2F1_9ACTN|nr:EAL domain-containing protein [Motilibacter rhizosphaerae]RZS77928.1 diguanylate cyclase (GGDEF)-like protein [Motilibacter rhizosphaerae]